MANYVINTAVQLLLIRVHLFGILIRKDVKGYRDHALKGDRKGQRSSYLSKSWRVIYQLDKATQQLTVEVLEVNHHEYKK